MLFKADDYQHPIEYVSTTPTYQWVEFLEGHLPEQLDDTVQDEVIQLDGRDDYDRFTDANEIALINV